MDASKLKFLADMQEQKKSSSNGDLKNSQPDSIIPFTYENEDYYVALMDSAMIFNSSMNLLYTIDYPQLEMSNMPLFKQVDNIAKAVKLKGSAKEMYSVTIKRNEFNESMSFTNRFDANFVFKKLKRIASRESENITEVTIEKDSEIVESFMSNSVKGDARLSNHLPKNGGDESLSDELEFLSTMSRVEDILEDLISQKISNISTSITSDSIDRCISLLEKTKKLL